MTRVKLKTAAICAAVTLATTVGVIMAENRQPTGLPNPIELLKTVAEARHKITSGEMEFEVNHQRFKVVFEGEHRRFETFGRGYSYVMMGPDAAQVTEAKIAELGLDREGAVQAGLLTEYERHEVTAYDGSALLSYVEISGQHPQAQITDPAKGSAAYVFDPRIFGLSAAFMQPTSTIENCLAYGQAKSVKLVGQANLDGIAAWHVQVLDKWDMNEDFWIDVGHPSHLVKSQRKSQYAWDTAVSRFDASRPEDPIPVDVLAVFSDGLGKMRSETHFVRREARLNVRVDPASWTFSGLNMQIGTPVVDVRNMRRIGYWNRTGLSEDLARAPSQTGEQTGKAQAPPNPQTLLKLAEQDPKSPFGLNTATWLILNTAEGPEYDKAAAIILQNHLGSSNLVYLCQQLLRLRYRSSTKLLQSVLDKNPSPEVQANACFALAMLSKDQANYGADEPAAAVAAKLFERVLRDYGQVEAGGQKLADRAESELVELRLLGVGKEAPEIQGEDLDGRQMKLSDYRGKVVALVFWGTWCGPCMAMVPDERKLVERMAGKPFALIGINSDKDLARARLVAAKEKITWASFRDGDMPGPIAKTWNVQSWPTVYVLDRKGVIRYRNVRGQDLADAVDKLLGQSRLAAQ
jgi:thiol-disulfide isomerase/thioredoxin